MSSGKIMNRSRRRSWWRSRRRKGWSRTTIWRLRLLFGLRLPNEPVLVAIDRATTGDLVGLLHVRIPHLGVEVLICRRVVRWRRVAKAARAPADLREAASIWETALRETGLRTWLSEPVESGRVRDPRKLEAVLCRALVMEVLGRRGEGRLGSGR
jgi:hypothetical protein